MEDRADRGKPDILRSVRRSEYAGVRSRAHGPHVTSAPLAWLVVLLGCAVSAQAAPDGLRLDINRVECDQGALVRCFATVTDAKGDPVAGLARSNFRVTEQGRPVPDFQAISTSTDGTAAAVALVVDTSGSMNGPALRSATTAAADFIRRLGSGDEVAVIAFSDTIGPETPLSTNRKAALAALTGLTAHGGTLLFDAALRAIDYVGAGDAKRKAVLILTDGKDTGSRASAEQCVARAKRAGIIQTCIGLGSQASGDVLSALAKGTGGRVYAVGSPDDLGEVYRGIAASLRHEYTIAYRSPLAGGKPYWRKVLLAADYRGAAAEAATQYVASAPPATGPTGDAASTESLPLASIVIIVVAAADIILVGALLVRRMRRRP